MNSEFIWLLTALTNLTVVKYVLGVFYLQGLGKLLKNHLIAELVTIIGSLDIVFG